ncbi:MAG: glycosyl hydrolase family 28 protein [Acidobacteriaceae bacterium]|nr:glycosyl hydrolase family 28 protein [Acidobacteriaceae bacterium]
MRTFLVAALCFASLAAVTHAQDTRAVVEPKVPPVCTRLVASLTADSKGGFVQREDHADTERIQKAIDTCGAGKAVELAMPVLKDPVLRNPGYNSFLSGPLELKDGVTLLIDKKVTLYASVNPADYDVEVDGKKLGLCGTAIPRPTNLPTFSTNQAARPKGGCRPFLSIRNAKNAGLMGDGVIDGRGYHQLVGHDYSWWQLARKSEPHDDLYFAPKLIVADHADGLTFYNITLHNSMNFHVSVGHTDGFTAWGVHLQTPTDKTQDARNTDGIDPGTSTNITIAHSWIDNGDDNIAIKQGVSHMSVLDNHFYSGHGMSIGSETVLGQSFLLVDGLVEDHTTSGIRIKSNVKRGGPVHDLVYRNVCMRDVPIPIAISPWYTNKTVEPFADPKYTGDKIPDYKRISLENIYSETPGDVLISGLNDEHRTEVTLRDVTIKGIKPEQVHVAFADLKVLVPWTNIPFGAAAKLNPSVHLQMSAGNVTTPTGGLPDPCAGKFVPMR